jgi:hypothetical protein
MRDQRSPKRFIDLFGGKAMDNAQSNYRIDTQFDAVLYDNGQWSINGQDGMVLCVAPNIREAIDRATGYTAAGAVVTALARVASDKIVVSMEQIGWLLKLIAGRETTPIKCSEPWLDLSDASVPK